MKHHLKKLHAIQKKKPWLKRMWILAVIAGCLALWQYEKHVAEGAISVVIVIERCFEMPCEEAS